MSDGNLFEKIAAQIGKTTEAIGKNFMEGVLSLETNAMNMAKQFGQGRENVVGIKQALADASDELTKVGVNITQALQKATEIQSTFTNVLGRSALLTTETFSKVQAMSDVTKQSSAQLIENFANAGISILKADTEVLKIVERSKAIGVDTARVSQLVVSNLDATTRFNFQGGVEGMAKMAAQAVNLRIDFNKMLSISEGLFDPEKAIEMASAMQRLGVSQSALLDPLRLMDMAQNDPGELQNQIAEMSKEFVRLNEKGQFEIMPGAKRQLMEVEKSLGLNRGELSKMALASAELEDKMNKIKLPDTFNEDQKKFIANMAQMGPGGEYKLKVDGEDIGLDKAISLFSQDKDKFEKFMEASTKKPKSIEDLANDQLTIQSKIANDIAFIKEQPRRLGMAVGTTTGTEQTIQATEKLFSSIPTMLGEGKMGMKELRTASETGINDVLQNLSQGDLTEGFSKMLGGPIEYLSTALGENFSKLDKVFEDFFTSADNKIVNAGRGVTGGVLSTINKYTGYDLGGDEMLEQNRKLMESNAKTSGKKNEDLEELYDKGKNTGEKYSKTDINYQGKIDLEIKAPMGMSEADWQRLSTKILEDPTFIHKLRTMLTNLDGNKSPTDLNKEFNSANPTTEKR